MPCGRCCWWILSIDIITSCVRTAGDARMPMRSVAGLLLVLTRFKVELITSLPLVQGGRHHERRPHAAVGLLPRADAAGNHLLCEEPFQAAAASAASDAAGAARSDRREDRPCRQPDQDLLRDAGQGRPGT